MEKDINKQVARNVVRKLYDFIVMVNNSFTLEKEKRISYINELVEKLNNDKDFINNLNIILANDNKNVLDKPLMSLNNKINNNSNNNSNNKMEKMRIKNKVNKFNKISRQNANDTLKNYMQRNIGKNMNKNMNKTENKSLLTQLLS
jgi:hypothetical protein